MQKNPLLTSTSSSPYYVVAPGYTRLSAGVRVLHILANELCKRGYQAFLLSSHLNPEFCAPPLTEEIVEFHNASRIKPIVIYPEVVSGNPINSDCVIRYILNHPGKLGGPADFPKDDLLVWYTKGMKNANRGEGIVLSIPYVDTSVFHFPDKTSRRAGACFYAHKFVNFHGGRLLALTDDATEIVGASNPGVAPSPMEIADTFRRSEVFYCYESSGLSFEALLCGCPVVLVPNEHFKKDEVILPDEFGWDGISWGCDESESAIRRETIQRVPSNMEAWMLAFQTQLDSFIEITQKSSLREGTRSKLRFNNPFDSGPSLRSDFARLQGDFDKVYAENEILKTKLRCSKSAELKQAEKMVALKMQCKRLRETVERWNGRNWFHRAFHKLRFDRLRDLR